MIKITTMVENTAPRAKLRAEHGLSVLVDTGYDKILFDTGQTDAIIHNAEVLNVDLSAIKNVVLSHGHYDHGGGLKYLLDIKTHLNVYAHPEIFRKRYSKAYGNSLRYIGIESREFYEQKGANFILDDKPIKIAENIYTTGFEPMVTDFESVDKNFVYETKDGYKKDDVPDDMSLVIETEKGVFVIFGCAHRGIINIIKHIENVFDKKVFGFIGGTHLGPASDFQREKTILELKKNKNLKIIGPSHCTGLLMGAKLYCEFDDKVIFNNVGTTIEI